MKVPNAERAQVDMRKLLEYALSDDHAYGKEKSQVFRSALGITSENADLLRDALLQAVTSDEAVEGKKDRFGQRYRVEFDMTGPNGVTRRIRSGWIIRFDEDFPRLATVYVR